MSVTRLVSQHANGLLNPEMSLKASDMSVISDVFQQLMSELYGQLLAKLISPVVASTQFWTISAKMGQFQEPLIFFFSRGFGKSEFGSLHGIPWCACIQIFSIRGVLPAHFLRGWGASETPHGNFSFQKAVRNRVNMI